MIPLFKVRMSSKATDLVDAVLKSGYIGEGPVVRQFESAVGDFIKNERVLALNSCTSAITLALRLAGVRAGSKVISTPMTCLATNMPILSLGAVPIWSDVDPYTGMVTVESIGRLLYEHPDAAAIVIMHWGGYSPDVPAILDVANSFNVPVIEDAAQAFGASIENKNVGTMSRFTCFSFQAIKQLTTGDGGALVCSSADDYERGRLLRWFGLDRNKSVDMRCDQDPPDYGYKFHMNDIAAAIGIANIEDIHDAIEKARRNAHIYDGEFCRYMHIYSRELFRFGASPWVYTINVSNVDKFIEFMNSNDVKVSRVHDRNDLKHIFRRSAASLPGVDFFDRNHVCLPVGWWLSDNDIDKIVNLVHCYKEVNNDNYAETR